MEAAETLKPVRGAQVIWRGVYEIEHFGHVWAVEVDYFDWAEKVRLYRDGVRVDEQRSPARFELPDGAVLEAKMGLFGMTKLGLKVAGTELPLRPAPGTAEARRAAFERRFPTASRALAALSWLILVVALIIEIPQLIELIARALGGEFDPPIDPSGTVQGVIGVLALLAALDRALRFKHSPWLDA
jgi:hypothetical protein